MNFLKKIKKDRGGFTAVQGAICSMVVILVLAFLADLSPILWKYLYISQTNTYISRTISAQSGIQNSIPNGFPGKEKKYVTSKELYSELKQGFKEAGIKTDDWDIYINGKKLSETTSIGPLEQGTKIECKILARYDYTFTSNLIPSLKNKKIPTVRNVYAGYQYRDEDIKFLK